MDQDKIFKIGLWVILVVFSLFALIEIFPFIKYILIIVGITVPTYILYNKNKKENDD